MSINIYSGQPTTFADIYSSELLQNEVNRLDDMKDWLDIIHELEADDEDKKLTPKKLYAKKKKMYAMFLNTDAKEEKRTKRQISKFEKEMKAVF